MGEIRIISLGKTRGYPYPVCKDSSLTSGLFHLPFPCRSDTTEIKGHKTPKHPAIHIVKSKIFQLRTANIIVQMATSSLILDSGTVCVNEFS